LGLETKSRKKAEMVRWDFFGPFEPWDRRPHVPFSEDKLSDSFQVDVLANRGDPWHYRIWDNRRVFAFAALMSDAIALCMAVLGFVTSPGQPSKRRSCLGFAGFFSPDC
jgi:hypothetical protein